MHFDSKEKSVTITPQMRQIIESTHEAFQKNSGSFFRSTNGIVLNQYVRMLCSNKKMTMVEYADFLQENYHCVIKPFELNRILFSSGFHQPRLFQNSEPLVNWSEKAAELLLQAFQGKRTAYDEFNAYVQTQAYPDRPLLGSQVRFLIITFYSKYPSFDEYGDLDELSEYEHFVIFYKYLDIMLDVICKAYHFSSCTFLKEQIKRLDKKREQRRRQRETQRQVNDQRIDQLQSNLTQKNSMLQDLQDNFDNQLADGKVTALTDFFAQLNSDRYGNILDMVIQLRKGVATLSKSGYELPEELNGLFTLYHKLVQFIRDSHIDPIRKIGLQETVCASDIEFCIYEGTPFTSEEETKLVETISPGWIYRDRNIQISRPKVKEIIVEEGSQEDETEGERELCAEGTEIVEDQQQDADKNEEALCAEGLEAVEMAVTSQNDEEATEEESLFTESTANSRASEASQHDETEASLREDAAGTAEKMDVPQPSNETEPRDE